MWCLPVAYLNTTYIRFINPINDFLLCQEYHYIVLRWLLFRGNYNNIPLLLLLFGIVFSLDNISKKLHSLIAKIRTPINNF